MSSDNEWSADMITLVWAVAQGKDDVSGLEQMREWQSLGETLSQEMGETVTQKIDQKRASSHLGLGD